MSYSNFISIKVLLIATVILLVALLASTFTSPDIKETEKEIVRTISICDEILKKAELTPVKKFEGTPAPVNFSSNPAAKTYFTAITKSAATGSNFAGHYNLATFGCGTSCIQYAIIDSLTGNIVDLNGANEYYRGMSFNIDNRLLTINPKESFEHLKEKNISDLESLDISDAKLGRDYYMLEEESDGRVWMNKICSENVLDGLYSLNNTDPSPITTELQESIWQTYSNTRFGYSINYPKDWKSGKEAENRDGKALHKDDTNEILVYGTLSPSTFSTQNTPVEREVFILSDGRKASEIILKDEENKIRYIVFFEDEGKQFTFFAKVSDRFFQENEQLLQDIAKTFKRIKGDEDLSASDTSCDNPEEITEFEKPIPVTWTAKLDGCLASCWGGAFTRVPVDNKYPRFSAYVPDAGEKIDDKFLKENQTLRISGKFTGIDSDHVGLFEGKCVPTVEIEKIEVVKQ